MGTYTVTTTIPYVNGEPHLGHALELVHADVLARHRRSRSDNVRFQTGTDDNALKNVRRAEADDVPVAELVARGAHQFEVLRKPLQLSFDDFIKTSSDPRHRPGVEKLWRASADRGDFYRKSYSGLYCVGCEQFYPADELTADGLCREHHTVPEPVEEENWFFRLSRYESQLTALIETERLRIEPATRRQEVLTFLKAGLEDFSVSRSRARARGWGVPVPGDADQVIYVWYDALANYITSAGYATDDDSFARWWAGADEIVHLVGKGVIRFHAVYWPAILLSAGVRLPDAVVVHEYLTVDGARISKSAGTGVNPVEVVDRYGTDALRWWLLRDVNKYDDTDFTVERLIHRANTDLANNIGNLINRTVSLVHRFRDGAVPEAPATGTLHSARNDAEAATDAALAAFDFHAATEAVIKLADAGNRYVESVRPWELAAAERSASADPKLLDAALGELVATCQAIGRLLGSFLPDSARRITAQCDDQSGRLAQPQALFPRRRG